MSDAVEQDGGRKPPTAEFRRQLQDIIPSLRAFARGYVRQPGISG